VEHIIQGKTVHQEFRGYTQRGKGRKELKRTHGMMHGIVNIRRDAEYEGTYAERQPKQARHYPTIHRNTMDWVSVCFVSFPSVYLTSVIISKTSIIDDVMGE